MIWAATVLACILIYLIVSLEISRRARRTSDLESSLEQIRKDLQGKTDALIQEREELSTLMSAISDAILAVDRGGKTLFFNSRFSLQFAIPGKDPLQALLTDLFRSPDALTAFSECMRTGLPQRVETALEVRPDQASHHFNLSIAPLKRSGDEVYGAVGVFHDVSELKKAEKIRIDFVANVSHELRTPLTAIKGYTDTLLSDVASRRFDSVSEFLGIIARNVDRLKMLVDDLLDLSALDAGLHVSKAEVSTREVTERILQQMEPKRREKDHLIETFYEASTVFADAKRLEQVLVNLIDNAIKYMSNSGRIEIRWMNTPSGVVLKVSDNGQGIPREALPRIFERFYRVDKGRSRDMGGTGLGLAIVKHIMQRHGGAISVSSEEEKGTEFLCSFPLVNAPSQLTES